MSDSQTMQDRSWLATVINPSLQANVAIDALPDPGADHTQMMADLCEMAQNGQLRPPPCTEHSLGDYKTALSKAMKPYVGSKQLLVM